MLDLHSLAKALGGEVSGNQVLAPGPGHSKTDRSLSVTLDASGEDIVVNSFTTDDPIRCKDYVRRVARLPAWQPGNGSKRNGNGYSPARTKREVEVIYSYCDAAGTLLYEVIRYRPKDFAQRRPDGEGGWIWKLDGVQRVLYRLPELLKYPDATVFVCEGEKDADRVASLGLCATTVAGGKWDGVDVECLRSRDCWVLEDADEPGIEKARKAATALQGVASEIRICRLHAVTTQRHGKDVSDWLDEDHRR